MKLNLSSADIIELTVTKTTVAILTGISDSFKAAATDAVSENDVKAAPYTLRNTIGYDVIINTDNTPFVYTQDAQYASGDYKLPNGFQIDFGIKPNIAELESSSEKRDFKVTVRITC